MEWDCYELFNCCDCGGNNCGCQYCFSCNACDNCLEEREEDCKYKEEG